MMPETDEAPLRAAVQAALPGARADLERLVAVPSVSADPARADAVRTSAELTAELIRATGCPDVGVVAAGGAPAVLARFPAPEGAPTVCLYAHNDVQPEGAGWETPPFVATERDGRLFGRGTADDKGGLALHLAVLRAFAGRPPVGVTLFIEGEEEVGSPSLRALLDAHRDDLAADLFVIADSSNWAVGEPAVTTTLRGLADCVVEVRTLDHAVHSGVFGGPVPDALTTLCRLLATLHDERGNVAVAGLDRAPDPVVDYSPERLRAESGLLPGVRDIGEGPVAARLWARPAVSVLALDATPVARASNTLAPSARAKVSLRVAPGDDARRARDLLAAHLRRHVPWGAQVTVTPGESGQGCSLPFRGPFAEAARAAFAEAYGRPPILIGQGGSIPMVAEFAAAFPEASIVVTAVADPDSRAHGANESVHLEDFAKACLAEALLLHSLGSA